MKAIEANFDGLVGPTHNYAGLAFGNLASSLNRAKPSNPREAARQGLIKMKILADLGLAQGILPPQERPHIRMLKRLGFTGRDADVLRKAAKEAPELLAAASSASAMWTANAATVSPSADTADGKVHLTPANLCSNLHRALEPEATAQVLQAIFPDPRFFTHHPPLPPTPEMSDEGAANQTRLCTDYGDPGLEIFVYGRGMDSDPAPTKFPARQTQAASAAIARLHGLDSDRTWFCQQNPAVIDQGVFHNDVVAVGNREVLLHHEQAFLNAAALKQWAGRNLKDITLLEISAADVSVEEAIKSYLFNSQLVCLPDGSMLLVVARECEESPRVWTCIQRLIEKKTNPIADVRVVDLRQSMKNGGGPACLRLRVVLTEAERTAVNPGCWLNAERFAELNTWVDQHYRDRLVFDDLSDPHLLDESRTALDRLTRILGLGSIYDFQR